MKLDSETTYFNTSLNNDPASKIIEYSDNCWESGVKADNEVGRERKNDMASVPESGNHKIYLNALPTEKYDSNKIDDEKGSHCYTGVDSINGTKTEEIELSEKELDFYTDKTITEVDLPELLLCYKDESYHVIKDICIDEGVPSLDKILLENSNVDHKRAIECPQSDLDENSNLSKEVTNSAVPVLDGLKSLILDGGHISCEDEEATGKCISDRLLVEGDSNVDAADKIVKGISIEKVIPESLHSVAEPDSGRMHADSSNFDGDEDQQRSDQGENHEANLSSPIASAADSNDSNHTKDIPSSGELESGSITFDFESLLTDISGREEGAENADCQKQSGQTLNMLVLEEGLSDSLTASTRSFFIHHGYGESSFSGMGPMSGPLTHSGPIPYSGSISHRSDSSTTSTRSFAFPILHSEWNSSPVKMAKASRRHYRKHRGWSLNLLCCRF